MKEDMKANMKANMKDEMKKNMKKNMKENMKVNMKQKAKPAIARYKVILITVLTLTFSASLIAAQEKNAEPEKVDSSQKKKVEKNEIVAAIGRNGIDAAIENAARNLADEPAPDALETAKKQMTLLLKIPELLEHINEEDFFTPYNPEITGKISSLLMQSANLETDECHKLYLTELAENISRNTFYTLTQDWLALENNVSEIIFVPNPVYENHRFFLDVLAPIDLMHLAAEGNGKELSRYIREQLQNEKQSYKLFDTFIYVNDPKETMKYEAYTRLYGKMRDRVATNRAPVTPFTGRPPQLKIAGLAYATSTNQLNTIYPHPELFYIEQAEKSGQNKTYKLIIFNNLVDIYVTCILDPLARIVLQDTTVVPGLPDEPSPKSVPVEVTADSFISNHVMYAISQNIGEIFALRPKINPQKKDTDDEFTSQEKGGKEAYNQEKVLKLISDVYKSQFLLMNGLKSTVVSLYNTRLLMEEGVLPWEKEADIYATYLAFALDRIRRNPKQPDNKHHVIMFNYLLKNGGIFFNITTRKISINVLDFRKNLDSLMKIVTEKYTFLIPSVRAYDIIGSELEAIVKMLRDIPTQTDVRFIN
jgi:hypothetical protein